MRYWILNVIALGMLCTAVEARAGVVQELQDQIDDLRDRVELLEGQVADLESDNSALGGLLDGVSRNGDTLLLEGMNLQIVNGLGETDGVIDDVNASEFPVVNGLGNLIIGYDEPRDFDSDKSGSHNLVMGVGSNYSSWGGIAAGYNNESAAPRGMAIGGAGSTALGAGSAVFGGFNNIANGSYSVASGGELNVASGFFTFVAGGYHNDAGGISAAIFGGDFNLAQGGSATVLGGSYNEASGGYASVSGGHYNIASGSFSSVSGGRENEASGSSATVSGGYQRSGATTQYDWVAGALFQDD